MTTMVQLAALVFFVQAFIFRDEKSEINAKIRKTFNYCRSTCFSEKIQNSDVLHLKKSCNLESITFLFLVTFSLVNDYCFQSLQFYSASLKRDIRFLKFI
jgi:hypothetical protein